MSLNTRLCFVPSVLVFLLVLVSPLIVKAQTTGPERVLIRNVILFDPKGVNLNYRYIWNELDGEKGKSSGLNSRVMLILQ